MLSSSRAHRLTASLEGHPLRPPPADILPSPVALHVTSTGVRLRIEAGPPVRGRPTEVLLVDDHLPAMPPESSSLSTTAATSADHSRGGALPSQPPFTGRSLNYSRRLPLPQTTASAQAPARTPSSARPLDSSSSPSSVAHDVPPVPALPAAFLTRRRQTPEPSEAAPLAVPSPAEDLARLQVALRQAALAASGGYDEDVRRLGLLLTCSVPAPSRQRLTAYRSPGPPPPTNFSTGSSSKRRSPSKPHSAPVRSPSCPTRSPLWLERLPARRTRKKGTTAGARGR